MTIYVSVNTDIGVVATHLITRFWRSSTCGCGIQTQPVLFSVISADNDGGPKSRNHGADVNDHQKVTIISTR